MKLLIRMLSFIIGHFDILERNTDAMTKDEYDAFMRIKSEFNKLSSSQLDELKNELDSMNTEELN